MRRDVQLGIIAETLRKTIPGVDAAVAERIFTALYGRPKEPGITPLAAITEVLRRPVPSVATADLITGADVRVYDAGVDDAADVPTPWAMEVAVLAKKIHDRLFGGQGPADAPPPDPRELSPVAAAEDAKRRRDLSGEIDALMGGERALKTAPWYPSLAGDLVHVHYEAAGHGLPAWGETYEVIEDPEFAEDMRLRLVHHTAQGDAAIMTGAWAKESGDIDPLYDMWFEAGPAVLTIVRDGRVVHLGPAVPGA
ncbi:hypothetical protein [Streptomyces niveus]|uniref:hypothetical protein n=1 Tax=Streptomyces niveus TaxID=193462 RepID=UPI00369A5AA8